MKYKDKPFDVIVDPIGGAAHVNPACLYSAAALLLAATACKVRSVFIEA